MLFNVCSFKRHFNICHHFDLVSDVFDYLRAVLLTREKSERTLELVTTALKLNPANYTAWVYRFVEH